MNAATANKQSDSPPATRNDRLYAVLLGPPRCCVIPSYCVGSTLRSSWAGHEARRVDPSLTLGMTAGRAISE